MKLEEVVFMEVLVVGRGVVGRDIACYGVKGGRVM